MEPTEEQVYELLKRERPELLAYHKFITFEIQKAYRDGYEEGLEEAAKRKDTYPRQR